MTERAINDQSTPLEPLRMVDAIQTTDGELFRDLTYVDYIRANSWNGVLPSTTLGDGGSVLFELGTK